MRKTPPKRGLRVCGLGCGDLVDAGLDVWNIHVLAGACEAVACFVEGGDELGFVHVAVGALDGCGVFAVDANCSPVEVCNDFDGVHGFPFVVLAYVISVYH
jgi:hypothetical protein